VRFGIDSERSASEPRQWHRTRSPIFPGTLPLQFIACEASEPYREFVAMNWFGHSGDLGDVIYALPTIRAAGGGILYLYHKPNKTWHGMDVDRAASLRSLLILQPYIRDVVFCPDGRPPGGSDHDLNGFRDHGRRGRNLADMHLATHGLAPEHRDTAWLKVDQPAIGQPVVFARSVRCRNERFPWRRIWEAYQGTAAFVGTAEEHEDFCRLVGLVPLVQTENLLAVARVIAGSRLFIGNQSCPAAIAEGLKKPIILEVFPALPNCCFKRPERIEAWDGTIRLPYVS
jgi:hypothetical protein